MSLDVPLFGTGPNWGDADVTIHSGDALDAYATWAAPDVIISDGAYGVGGFPGDPKTADGVPDWYQPHIEAWSAAAKPSTVLFFWCTEVAWALTHQRLVDAGWVYAQTIIWDKGIAHVAGNYNSTTARTLPVVTELCGVYTRPMTVRPVEGANAQTWLREEWRRTGLAWKRANDACGVKDAATRKYLTADACWYPPPPEVFARLAAYANEHGDPAGAPYFNLADEAATAAGVASPDGGVAASSAAWEKLRYTFNARDLHGLSNVWQMPALRGKERLKTLEGKTAHLNQKPLELMRRCVKSIGGPGDVVWEPFGGTATAAIAAAELDRRAFVAEANPVFEQVLRARLGLPAAD